MTGKEIQNMAELLGIRFNGETDGEIFKAILVAEGLTRCFGVAARSCNRANCLLWHECEKYNRFIRYLC
jgi:hypothetical protein